MWRLGNESIKGENESHQTEDKQMGLRYGERYEGGDEVGRDQGKDSD